MEHPAYTLSALCAVGGIMGYARRGSVPSLIAGSAVSILYGASGYLLHRNADYGLEIALGSSVLLLSAGVSRAFPTKFKKPLPWILMTLGGTATAYYTKKYNEFY